MRGKKQMESESFMKIMRLLKSQYLLSNNFIMFLEEHANTIENLFKKNNEAPCERNDNLLPNETIMHMFMRIALYIHGANWERTMECFSYMKAGIVCFDEYVSKFSGTQSIACFTKDTIVWTINGAKPISSLSVGDSVLTHRGHWQPILKIHCNVVAHRQLYDIYSIYGYIATSTNDHVFIVYNSDKDCIEWKTLQQITYNDYFMRPIPSNQTPSSFSKIHPRVLGLLFSTKKIINNKNYFDVEIPHDKHSQYRNLILDHDIYYQIGIIHCKNMELIKLLDDYSERRHVIELAIKEINTEFAFGWMDGYNEYSSIDEKELVLVCTLLNITFHDKHFIYKDGLIQEQELLNNHSKHTITKDGNYFMRFLYKKKHYSQSYNFVYSLEIEHDRSYTINTGVVVSNCNNTRGGLTPDTMILTDSGFKAICDIHPSNDYIIDPHLNKKKIYDVDSYDWEGNVINIDGKTITEDYYHYIMRTNNGIIAYPDIFQENNELTTNVLHFLVKWLFVWEYKISGGWTHWTVSIGDFQFLPEICKNFYSFDVVYDYPNIKVRSVIINNYVDNILNKLHLISFNKMAFFCSQVNRYDRRDDKRIAHFLHLFELVFMIKDVSQCFYKGKVYSLNVDGNKFITEHGIISIPTSLSSSNLCVSGSTRILTSNGIIPIENKVDELVSVWNGDTFSPVYILQTGVNKKLVRVEFSDGVVIECTPYHKFFIKNNVNEVQTKAASELIIGNKIFPFSLPNLHSKKIPSSIRMSLEWIANKCINLDEYIIIYERDRDSLIDMKLDLQYCGIHSHIYSHDQHKYELRIAKDKWKQVQSFLTSDNDVFYQGDIVNDITISRISHVSLTRNTFCFHEYTNEKGIFEGICTGQCNNILSNSHCASIFILTICNDSIDKLYKFIYNVTQELIILSNLLPTNNNSVCIIIKDFDHIQNLFDFKTLKYIIETIHYASLSCSCNMSDSCSKKHHSYLDTPNLCHYDWLTLKSRIQLYGLRNNVIISPLFTPIYLKSSSIPTLLSLDQPDCNV